MKRGRANWKNPTYHDIHRRPYTVMNALQILWRVHVAILLDSSSPSAEEKTARTQAGSRKSPRTREMDAAFLTHGFILQANALRMMNQAVEDAVGDGRIADLRMPVLDRDCEVRMVERV
jgi:hypothetical protein